MFGAVFRSFLAEGEGIRRKAISFRGGGLNAREQFVPFYGGWVLSRG